MFCIKQINIILILVVIAMFVGIAWNMSMRTEQAKQQVSTSHKTMSSIDYPNLFPYPQHIDVNVSRPSDMLSNPEHPPLKDTAFLYGGYHTRPLMPTASTMSYPVMPINQPTQPPYMPRSSTTSYVQIGILTRKQGEKILPLMGRPSVVQRNKWQYYTMSDSNTSVRLPVSRGGRSCTSENGCDEIMNGDTVYVEGYQDAFHATVYENDSPRYIPYLY